MLVNNYLAVTRGTDLIGVHAYRTERVELWNNVVEVEAITSTGAAVVKRALLLEELDPDSFDLINNILVVWQNPLDATGAVAIEERSEGSIGKLRHNLLFVEAAERGRNGAYVKSGGTTYSRTAFPDYADDLDSAGNLLLPPLFHARRLEHWRSQTHLSLRSPAIDGGQTSGAPAEDRFGRPRPIGAAVDIGIEEFLRR